MPGKRITKQQVKLYMENKKENSQKIAAAKAGFCERSARNVEKRGFEPVRVERNWRTRKDPFDEVWENELLPLLQREPGLQANTLLEYLQKQYADGYPDSLIRTLQRRVKKWKAIHGPEQEIIFRQNHPPGEQGISDFTHASSLNVTINGERLSHLLYHYRLTFSGWEYVQVVQGGESYTALAEGLQNALWMSGGVPATHRTDSLAAAYKNLSDKQKEDFTQDYQELCNHYGMKPTRNNKGVSHENGTIEASHGHLKTRINQALMLRGSREFLSIKEYKEFMRELSQCRNRRIHKRYLEELAYLSDLPERKTTDYAEERIPVTSGSTIYVKKVLYSVPSRLIGMTIKVHIYDDRLECFIGADPVVTLTRKRVSQGRHKRCIDYRHVVGSLARKPQAFRNYIYKEEMFPTLAFRQTWELLDQKLDQRKACREYVGILKEAAKEDHEKKVNAYLEKYIEQDILPTAEMVRKLFSDEKLPHPRICDNCDDLSSYNQLLSNGGEI